MIGIGSPAYALWFGLVIDTGDLIAMCLTIAINPDSRRPLCDTMENAPRFLPRTLPNDGHRSVPAGESRGTPSAYLRGVQIRRGRRCPQWLAKQPPSTNAMSCGFGPSAAKCGG